MACSLPWAAAQLCDDNPLANNGIKIKMQASISCLKGRTPDMTEVGTCRDNSAHDIQLPFAFKFLDRSYSGNGSGSVFVSSNSYVTFGGSSLASSGLGPRTPAFPTLFIGGRDNAMRNLSVGPDALGWRVRYEGWSLPSLVNTHNCSLMFPPSVEWELLFLRNGALQLCTGTLMDHMTSVSAVSDGVSESLVQKFTLTPSTSYTIFTGLGFCECDDTLQVSHGVKITSQPSQTCMKGRTPDMIDVRSCQRAGSTSIFLPFPFSFLGRTYGGQSNDVFVGDSSFVTFGGAEGNFYSSFDAEFSDIPVLLIGARQNLLKTLSVAPDPLGWRVRYEGWSNQGASLGNYPQLSQAFSCNNPSSLVANITWELLFLFDGSLQLCTSSLMGNLDPIFDSFAIKERLCTSNLTVFAQLLCTNFFQNLSSISAVSDGRTGSFLRKFDLMPSTLYTISTGVRQCNSACDDNPQVNNGVSILSQVSFSCLKGQTPDMTVVGRCSDNGRFSIRLPFPFHFLGRSYSGGDIFVGSNSEVTFANSAETSARPSIPALLIGARDNSLKRLSVGPDPLGWRVRFEGWDTFLSLYRTIDCRRPADIVWELLFTFNNTMQLCTSSLMNNLDLALNPNAASGVWDGTSLIGNMNMTLSSLYSISTSLPPCHLHLSLSSAIAAVNGSSLTASFPVNLRLLRYDSVTLIITLQGSGFSSGPDTPITLIVLPASSRATGTARISNSTSSTPLLTVSFRGVANCSLLKFTIPSITTPMLPQSSRKNIRFSLNDPDGGIIFASTSGSLVEIIPNMIYIDEGQPLLKLTNSAIQSLTTINISFIPNIMNIPTAFAPSVLVISLVGAGWTLPSPAQGLMVKPLKGVFASATMSADLASTCVLRVSLSGAFSISNKSTLELLLFNVTTVSVPQPADVRLRSAILNSAGAIIASGTNGRLDAIVASTMGLGSPALNVVPPVASATGVRIEISMNPQFQYQQSVNLPARIIITLTGYGFSCSSSTIVTFSSPFDVIRSTLNVSTNFDKVVLTVRITSGTFFSGYPVAFHFGPCAAPFQSQPRKADVFATMIDGNGSTLAASSIGTLSEIVDDLGPLNLHLTDNLLNVTFTPLLPVPVNSFLVISLAGVGLACSNAQTLHFTRPAVGAFGTLSIIGRPVESVLNISFSRHYSTGIAVSFYVSQVYGSCSSQVGNIVSALVDKSGNVLAASTTSNLSSTITQPDVTVQQLIDTAKNSAIIIPVGTFAGKCNCNSRIDESVPSRKSNSPVEMTGTAGRSIIDCSGTGMRCLIVQNSTVRIVDIIFKGGSSPVFVSASDVAAVWAIFDAENQTLTDRSCQTSRSASSGKVAGSTSQNEMNFQLPGMINRSFNQSDEHIQRGLHVEGQSHELSKSLFSKNKGASDIAIPLTNQAVRLMRKNAQSSSASTNVIKRHDRHLLQSERDNVLSTFDARVDESGGCILVVAPTHLVTLIGVSLISCSAIFGGGGFFNVSHFDAKDTIADGNCARQGGGIFVAAPKSTQIEMSNFLNNRVAAYSFSQRPSTSTPDSAWAAGAAVWSQRLTKIKNCTFERNVALAAKTIAGKGSHALGSGLYILQTSSGSLLSDLLFVHSASLCAGAGCYSAGSLFIAVSGMNTSIQGLQFVECQVAAIKNMFVTSSSPPVEASGACISVIDASAGMLTIEGLYSKNSVVRSSGAILGGCMCFSKVHNAIISHVSVLGFKTDASLIFSPTLPFTKCGMGGIAFFATLKNTIISNVYVDTFLFQCMGDATGAVIHAEGIENTNISSVHVSNIRYSGAIGRLFGGVFYFLPVATISLTNISIQNSSFLGRSFNGAFIFVGPENPYVQESTGIFSLRGLVVRNVSAHAESVPECFQFAPIYSGDGAISFISMNVFTKGLIPMTIELESFIFQNTSVSCAAKGCTNYGLHYLRTELFHTPYRTVDNRSQSLHFSNASFEDIISRCQGAGCSVRGACLALSVRDAILMHIRLKRITAISDGFGSFAGGSFLFHFHNNPSKSMRVINVTTEDATVYAYGSFSTAIGGVIAAFYGNLLMENVRFLRSLVSCFGLEMKCQAMGGSVAFSSSLGPSNKRENEAFSATIINSKFEDAIVKCSGETCEATGGAIFAGISYRGPFEIIQTALSLRSQGLRPLQLVVYLHNCSIINNVVESKSISASVSGGGVSILLLNLTITNSRILGNVIHSSKSVAFAGGGGIYVSGYNSSATVISTIIQSNNASEIGSGGAIFAGPQAVLSCENSVLDFNSAKKGGGLFVEAASASIYSCSVCNNSAQDKGGGIFCVMISSLNTTAELSLSNVTVVDNILRNEQRQSVGAAVYVFGDVKLETRNGSRFSMNGNYQYTTTEVVFSVSRQTNISNDIVVSCKSGAVLSLALTEVENQNIKLFQPSVEDQFNTQCNPACLFTNEINMYTASGGFMASCVPCPRGTYSLTASSDKIDTVSSKCIPCPFGAFCNGGSRFGALNGHWGWKVSESKLTDRFILLLPGYACEANCSTISPCGGNRAGILCGGCATRYSLAFFSTSCVPSVQCSLWKWAPLVFICIAFQFFFSIFVFQYMSESDMLQKQERTYFLSKQALEKVSLFHNLSPCDFDAVVSKMELVHVAAQSDVLIQGQTTSYMYIIETGVLSVYLHDNMGKELLLATLVAPNVVGEQSFIKGVSCAASVRALVDCDLWRLNRNCLENVAENDMLSFVNVKQAQYAKSAPDHKNINKKDAHDDLWRPLSVLMWFYQLAGIMLSVSSPLKYIDGSAASFSVISLLVNAKPSQQAASDISTQTATSFSAEDAGPFQFCVSSSFSYSQMYLATLMYYVAWAVLMALLVQNRVWKLVRSMIIHLSLGIDRVWDLASSAFKNRAENGTNIFAVTFRERVRHRQSIEIEIRGPVILKWFVTCFSAVASLMMQGTSCIRLTGLLEAEDELRWIYDGRVACFFDSGELPGRWQVLPAVGVVFVLIAPVVLWRIMVGIKRLDECMRSPFQRTLLEAYSGPYFSNAFHWMVVM